MTRAILTTELRPAKLDVVQAVQRVARLTDRKPFAVALDLLRAVRKPRFFGREEYFTQGAWVGTEAERAAVLSHHGNKHLNSSLIGRGDYDQSALINDKYLTGLILEANGFAVPKPRAAFSADRAFGTLPTLTTAADLAGWLSDPANLPVFAKPVNGSRALGSVPLLPAGDGVDIGGRVVDPVALAGEVARHYPRGWLMQELITQPPEMEALIGPGVGTVRIVTLWEEDGPQLFYGVWRLPPVGEWVDSVLGVTPNVGCALDPHTGAVVQAHRGDRFTGKGITHSPVLPGLPLVGFHIPQWSQAVEICREAHRLFPGHALLGWDIGISRRGPLICEVNTNPLHMSYQRAFGHGLMTTPNRSRLDAARQVLGARLARYGRVVKTANS